MKIYFATGNSGKAKHASEILGDQFEVEQLDIETIELSVDSIETIAENKVMQAIEKSDKEDEFIIADDSGLFIEDLNGFPGPQTHFFDRKVGKDKILNLVDEGAKAEFRAAIALYNPQSDETEVFTGKAKGEIVKPRGDGGFGYDPLFLPEGNDKTWGEEPEYKNQVSHREEALKKLRDYTQEVEN
ncbi:MAG: XTP/dITP diphosphohydrolase [Candidatus Nanohaloarchaea archaeon]|jgi:XTP/dITP diphosphohydrolase